MNSKRITKLKNIIDEKRIDALFITNFYNILYFTGFRTLVPHEREAYVLVTKNNTYVFSDGRYADNIQYPNSNNQFPISKQAPISNKPSFKLLSTEKGLMRHLQEIIKEEKIVKLGFEKDDLKWSEYDTLQKMLGVELIPQDRVGVKIRAVKEIQEIEKIQKACEIGDECLSDISKLIKPDTSEKEIGWKIESWIRQKGYEVAFDPIVAVDANSAIPHYDTKNGNGHVKNNSIILIDMGVRYEGYNSDITRMFFMGEQPDEVVNAYQTLLDAQTKTIQLLSKNQKLADVDRACRKFIGESFPTYPHSTGHGVGLEVHENPKVSGISEELLQSGNVITIEPGIYIPGKWGMRIEDTVVVEKQVRVLTAYPKSMQVL